MYERLTTIFVSIAMVAAVETFIKSGQAATDWCLLTYFLVNSIRYYYGDFRFQEEFARLKLRTERAVVALDFHMYVVARLLIIVASLKIDDLIAFCIVSIVYQLLSVGHLSFSLSAVCVGDEPKIERLRSVQRSWIAYSVAEALLMISLATAFRAKLAISNWLYVKVEVIEVVSLIAVCTGLLFVIVIDWVKNRDFLFEDSQ